MYILVDFEAIFINGVTRCLPIVQVKYQTSTKFSGKVCKGTMNSCVKFADEKYYS